MLHGRILHLIFTSSTIENFQAFFDSLKLYGFKGCTVSLIKGVFYSLLKKLTPILFEVDCFLRKLSPPMKRNNTEMINSFGGFVIPLPNSYPTEINLTVHHHHRRRFIQI